MAKGMNWNDGVSWNFDHLNVVPDFVEQQYRLKNAKLETNKTSLRKSKIVG